MLASVDDVEDEGGGRKMKGKNTCPGCGLVTETEVSERQLSLGWTLADTGRCPTCRQAAEAACQAREKELEEERQKRLLQPTPEVEWLGQDEETARSRCLPASVTTPEQRAMEAEWRRNQPRRPSWKR
jgi:hypothetical protein